MGEFTLVIGKPNNGIDVLGMDKNGGDNYGTLTPNYAGEEMKLITEFTADTTGVFLAMGDGGQIDNLTHIDFTTETGAVVSLAWDAAQSAYFVADGGAFYNILKNHFYDVVRLLITYSDITPITLNGGSGGGDAGHSGKTTPDEPHTHPTPDHVTPSMDMTKDELIDYAHHHSIVIENLGTKTLILGAIQAAEGN